jgi:hypothetical protein
MSAVAAASSRPVGVRLAKAAVDALRALPLDQQAAVARAIRSIGTAIGVPLKPTGDDGKQYLVMVPDHDQAPVIIYRQLDEGGYLVTGLSDRDTFDTYERADQPSLFDSPLWKALLSGAAGVVLALILGSRSGKNPLPR